MNRYTEKIILKNNGKERTIVKFTDEFKKSDRLKEWDRAQQELSRLVGRPRNSFAYVSLNESTPSTFLTIEPHLKENNRFFYPVDISDFFGSIDRGVLVEKVMDIGIDERTFKAIVDFLIFTQDVQEFWGFDYSKGLIQGFPLSPILSHIYLTDFDNSFRIDSEVMYTRYSDDILLSSDNLAELLIVKNRVGRGLGNLGLAINKDKSKLIDIRNGQFVFLGINIKAPEKKFRVSLSRRYLSKTFSSSDEKYVEGRLNYYKQFQKWAKRVQ